MIKKIKDFANEVVAEMKKVSWPTKDQLRESTIVVIVTSMIFTVFAFFIDTIMTIVSKGLVWLSH
ncbi:MAG: preprotein translocase subunit SecE [Candidatus Kapabacteria bacterium]|nr:preprotein translocase subunit SecE [Candidatus Kapabacteria bacterium]